MTDKEQTQAFANDLDNLVNRYYREFDLSYAQAVGVLQMKQWLLIRDAADREDEV
jgi:hypothetical protein